MKSKSGMSIINKNKIYKLFLALPLMVTIKLVGATDIATNTTDYAWNGGELNILSGVTVSTSATNALQANSGTTLTNSGTISGSGGSDAYLQGPVTISSIINNGVIRTTTGTGTAIDEDGGVLTALTNNGTITSYANNAIFNLTTIGAINNSVGATISGGSGSGYSAIYNYGSLTSLANYGSIIGATGIGSPGDPYTGNNAITNGSSAILGTLTNYGTITAPGGGVDVYNNGGTITNLNNAQGAGSSSGALTYSGTLPTNYKIILGANSSTYGKLNYSAGSGTLSNFGIYAGTISSKLYTAVLAGITAVTSGTTGTYAGQAYRLTLEGGSTTVWDLLFPNYYSGPSTADTQQSLVNTSAALQNIFTLQNTVLANSFSYDCNVFGANNVCVSAGGRNTQVSAANGLNNTSALLIAAYRVMPSIRIGAYADQNLSVNNAGSTVNLGNNTPLIGLFGAWNERLDGTGTEVKVSAAYGQKNTTVTRQVVGTSEAGSGSSQLNSQGAQVAVKYGFGVVENVIVTPYVGVRYTQNNMNGYSEQATSSVTAPLTYSALNTNATTALAGVGAQYRFIPQATAFASAGVETDTNTANGSYSATGVTGLTPINFNANPVKTRPTAMVGATYDVEKNQRIGITGIYRQEPYQAVSTTTVMATYTVGL